MIFSELNLVNTRTVRRDESNKILWRTGETTDLNVALAYVQAGELIDGFIVMVTDFYEFDEKNIKLKLDFQIGQLLCNSFLSW